MCVHADICGAFCAGNAMCTCVSPLRALNGMWVQRDSALPSTLPPAQCTPRWSCGGPGWGGMRWGVSVCVQAESTDGVHGCSRRQLRVSSCKADLTPLSQSADMGCASWQVAGRRSIPRSHRLADGVPGAIQILVPGERGVGGEHLCPFASIQSCSDLLTGRGVLRSWVRRGYQPACLPTA